MRILSLVGLLVLVAVSGCIADDPAIEPDAAPGEATSESAQARAERLNRTLADMEEFCVDEESCDFWDQEFHEYVVYDLDTVVFDVLVVPPGGGATPDNIAASRLAAQAWSDGIEELGETWMTDAFEMNVNAVGIDVPSIEAAQDPEIVIISTSALGVLGIGLEPVQFICQFIGQDTLADLGGHFHGGNWVGAANCAGTGFTCFAINGGGLAPGELYDLIAHEVGHCLGAGHVGDALDFRARYAPVEDIMSYQSNQTQVHCVSNLNVRVLEGVYAHLLDRPEREHLPSGSYLNMSPLDYMQVECDNPPGMSGSAPAAPATATTTARTRAD